MFYITLAVVELSLLLIVPIIWMAGDLRSTRKEIKKLEIEENLRKLKKNLEV